jgi:hypothetical protein
MPNSTVNFDTVELCSTDRPAPLNGTYSSADLNDSMREILSDLASVVNVWNDAMRPMLNALQEKAAEGDNPIGIEGRTVFTDTSDNTSLFFDAKTSTSLTIADSFRLMSGMVRNLQTKVDDLYLRVNTLNTQLSMTNQNDIANTLQGFSDTLADMSTKLTSNSSAITDLAVRVANLESK